MVANCAAKADEVDSLCCRYTFNGFSLEVSPLLLHGVKWCEVL